MPMPAPLSFSIKERYSRAAFGSFPTAVTPCVGVRQPGIVLYIHSIFSQQLASAGISSVSPPFILYATQTGISAKSSSTSSLVTTSHEVPLIIPEYASSGRSSQPQRRGRPVTAPNSLPRLRILSPAESNSSVGNGPSPTRVQYALLTPITESIVLGATPVPITAPPEVALDEVTKG